MLDTVNALLTQNKIPSLDDVQMSSLLLYLFTKADKKIRLQVAEVVYRYNHDHPQALDIFLASLLPLAEKTARRRAQKMFYLPSDWQIELMYDGAVAAVIRVFEQKTVLTQGNDVFQRYLARALAVGTIQSYFMRGEYDNIRTVANLATVPTRKRPFRNQVEQDMITRQLLTQVTSFPNLPSGARATLECIQMLGPDRALKEHAYRAVGDRDKHKRERGRRSIIDPKAVAQAMGTDRVTVHRNLRKARLILRDAFNADGKLFFTR